MNFRGIRGAFTLVELLVVITIIGVLVATFLPALGTARYLAKEIVCASQLRQQGVGMNAYTNDFKFFYPLFGGAVGDIGYGRTGSTSGWGTFTFDANVYNAFGTYIGLPTGTPSPMASLHKIKYCPMVTWYPYPTYIWANPSFTPYWAGEPGYNYYTGRQMAGGTWSNFNTINRRNDPKEILITDQTMQGTETGDFPAWGTSLTAAIPWFNPHVERSCRTAPSGTANHLVADGRVVNLPFTSPYINFVSAYYAIAYFSGVVAGPSTTLTDGPYAAIR